MIKRLLYVVVFILWIPYFGIIGFIGLASFFLIGVPLWIIVKLNLEEFADMIMKILVAPMDWVDNLMNK